MTSPDDGSSPMLEAEFGFPGPLRDQLVASVLEGTKTTSSVLLHEFEVEGRPLPVAGQRERLVDSDGRPVGIIEITDVRVCPLAQVDLRHVLDEGEGYLSVPQWRASHERFWTSPELAHEMGGSIDLDDDTPVVLVRFRALTD